ncbi:MAG: hypothetical protein ABJB55_06965 [Actinomycetota bacterium]
MNVRLPRALLSIAAVAMLATGLGVQGAAARPLPQTSHVGRIVTLITGERVVLGTATNGTATAEIVRAADHGPAAQLKTIRIAGDTYAIPASAEPYLGRYLDVGLFDVTALTSAGFGERIPLRITFEPGSPPSLPGVTITSSGAGSATGFVTRASARVFGAALADQAVFDSASGWPATSAVFGSVTGIALDLPVAPVVIPQYPQTTVIIKGISNTGRPMRFAFGLLMNMDNGQKFTGFVFMVRGEARASVPLGTYTALFDELEFSSDGSATIREMVVNDIAVTGSQPAITIDGRQATTIPSVSTPKTTIAQALSTDLVIDDASGHFGLSWGWEIGFPGARMRFMPAAPPTVGKMHLDTRWTSIDPSTPGGRYLFDASFTDPGIPADQARHLPAVSEASVVRNIFASDRLLASGGAGRFVFLPHEFFASAVLWPTPMPLDRTEYVYAPPRSSMQGVVLANDFAPDPGIVEGGVTKLVAGTARVEQWFRNPYVLSVPEPLPGARFVSCLACTTAHAMTFALALNDDDPTHDAWVFGSPNGKPVATFDVYRDGALLLHERDSLGDSFHIPTGNATYRVVSNVTRRWTGAILSTATETDVTFRSGQGVPAPSSFYCYTGSTCTVMPVLTAHVDLHATSVGTLPFGTSTLDIVTGHIHGAAELPIASVAAAWRRTGSSTWHEMPITTVGPNLASASFKAMPWMDQRRFDVRVTVTDAKGGVLVQTTDSAFLVSP